MKVDKKVVDMINSSPIYLTQEIIDQLKVGDYIDSGFEEGYEGSDSSMESHYRFYVIRMVEETPKQIEHREYIAKIAKKHALENRYQNYLSLKEEFESMPDSQMLLFADVKPRKRKR